MRALAACGLLLAATAFASDVDVRSTAGGRVSLQVGSAPLSEVLDRLARQTGMKVVYDGAPPRALVRGRHVEDVTPAEAVLNVLEGLGVGYALRFDPDGIRVDTLLVLGTAGVSGPRPVGAPPALRPPVAPPGPSLIMEEPDEDSSAGQSPNLEELFSARPGREEKEEAPQMGPPAGPPPPFPGFPNILPAPQAPATPAPTTIGPLFITPTPAPSPPPQ